MRTDLKIDFVAPPLAGHLFPQLQLARYAKSQGYENLRFLSCPKMRTAVESAGIEFLTILSDKEDEVLDIAHAPNRSYGDFESFCVAIDAFVNNGNGQFYDELKTFLTLNFQTFENVQFLDG